MRKESEDKIDENIGVRYEWRLGNFTTAVPRRVQSLKLEKGGYYKYTFSNDGKR